MSEAFETKTIELSRPFVINGVDVTTLEMREPTVGDQFFASRQKGDDLEKTFRLILRLIVGHNITPEELHKMSQKDYLKLVDAYSSFLD